MPTPPAATCAVPVHVQLLGGFAVTAGSGVVHLPHHAERLLAFLALQARPQPRGVVAAALWSDADERRAAANVRTAVWRVRAASPRLLFLPGRQLQLHPDVQIDLSSAVSQARELLDGPVITPAQDSGAAAARAGLIRLDADLLPMWEEPWVTFERERLRQLRMHALEALSLRLSGEGRHAGAVEAGRLAVALEPLRESGREVLILAHLAQGNIVEASRELEDYRTVLLADLGVSPSLELTRLVATPATAPRQRHPPGGARPPGAADG